jgi:HAMP domain-containing protein
VPITGWSVITSVPATTLNAAFYRQLMLIAGALGLLIVGFTSFSYYASRQLSEPLSTMAQKAQVIARGGYGTRLEVPKETELGTIAGAINDLKSEVRVKERRMSEAEEQFHLLPRDLPLACCFGAHGEYIESNAAFGDMLGVTEDEPSENTAFSMDWPVRGTFRKDGKPTPQERNPIVLAYTTRRQETSEPVEIYRADARRSTVAADQR